MARSGVVGPGSRETRAAKRSGGVTPTGNAGHWNSVIKPYLSVMLPVVAVLDCVT